MNANSIGDHHVMYVFPETGQLKCQAFSRRECSQPTTHSFRISGKQEQCVVQIILGCDNSYSNARTISVVLKSMGII